MKLTSLSTLAFAGIVGLVLSSPISKDETNILTTDTVIARDSEVVSADGETLIARSTEAAQCLEWGYTCDPSHTDTCCSGSCEETEYAGWMCTQPAQADTLIVKSVDSMIADFPVKIDTTSSDLTDEEIAIARRWGGCPDNCLSTVSYGCLCKKEEVPTSSHAVEEVHTIAKRQCKGKCVWEWGVGCVCIPKSTDNLDNLIARPEMTSHTNNLGKRCIPSMGYGCESHDNCCEDGASCQTVPLTASSGIKICVPADMPTPSGLATRDEEDASCYNLYEWGCKKDKDCCGKNICLGDKDSNYLGGKCAKPLQDRSAQCIYEGNSGCRKDKDCCDKNICTHIPDSELRGKYCVPPEHSEAAGLATAIAKRSQSEHDDRSATCIKAEQNGCTTDADCCNSNDKCFNSNGSGTCHGAKLESSSPLAIARRSDDSPDKKPPSCVKSFYTGCDKLKCCSDNDYCHYQDGTTICVTKTPQAGASEHNLQGIDTTTTHMSSFTGSVAIARDTLCVKENDWNCKKNSDCCDKTNVCSKTIVVPGGSAVGVCYPPNKVVAIARHAPRADEKDCIPTHSQGCKHDKDCCTKGDKCTPSFELPFRWDEKACEPPSKQAIARDIEEEKGQAHSPEAIARDIEEEDSQAHPPKAIARDVEKPESDACGAPKCVASYKGDCKHDSDCCDEGAKCEWAYPPGNGAPSIQCVPPPNKQVAIARDVERSDDQSDVKDCVLTDQGNCKHDKDCCDKSKKCVKTYLLPFGSPVGLCKSQDQAAMAIARDSMVQDDLSDMQACFGPGETGCKANRDCCNKADTCDMSVKSGFRRVGLCQPPAQNVAIARDSVDADLSDASLIARDSTSSFESASNASSASSLIAREEDKKCYKTHHACVDWTECCSHTCDLSMANPKCT